MLLFARFSVVFIKHILHICQGLFLCFTGPTKALNELVDWYLERPGSLTGGSRASIQSGVSRIRSPFATMLCFQLNQGKTLILFILILHPKVNGSDIQSTKGALLDGLMGCTFLRVPFRSHSFVVDWLVMVVIVEATTVSTDEDFCKMGSVSLG